jgi:hypothetical protein
MRPTRRVGAGKSHRLVAQCRQHVFVPQQSRAVVGDDQYRSAASRRGYRPDRLRRRSGRRQTGQPNLETAALARRALYVDRSAVLAHDLAYRGESQAVAGRTRGEKRLEDPSQRSPLHAATGIAHRDAHVTARLKLTMTEETLGGDVVDLGLELDAAGIFHRLRCVVAEVEDHLLQLRKLAGHDGGHRRFTDRQNDPRRQRDIQQRLRLADQSPAH